MGKLKTVAAHALCFLSMALFAGNYVSMVVFNKYFSGFYFNIIRTITTIPLVPLLIGFDSLTSRRKKENSPQQVIIHNDQQQQQQQKQQKQQRPEKKEERKLVAALTVFPQPDRCDYRIDAELPSATAAAASSPAAAAASPWESNNNTNTSISDDSFTSPCHTSLSNTSLSPACVKTLMASVPSAAAAADEAKRCCTAKADSISRQSPISSKVSMSPSPLHKSIKVDHDDDDVTFNKVKKSHNLWKRIFMCWGSSGCGFGIFFCCLSSLSSYSLHKNARWPVLISTVSGCVRQMVVPIALMFTTANAAGIIQPAVPVFSSFIAIAYGLEKFSIMTGIAVLFCMVGLFVSEEGWNFHVSFGFLLLLLVPISKGFQIVATHLAVPYHPPRIIQTYQITGLIVLTFPVAVALELGIVRHGDFLGMVTDVGKLNAACWFAILFTVFGILLVAWRIQIFAIKTFGSIGVSLYQSFQPLFTFVFAYWFLDEPVDKFQIIGAVIVCVGLLIYILQKHLEHKKRMSDKKLLDKKITVEPHDAVLSASSEPLIERFSKQTSEGGDSVRSWTSLSSSLSNQQLHNGALESLYESPKRRVHHQQHQQHQQQQQSRQIDNYNDPDRHNYFRANNLHHHKHQRHENSSSSSNRQYTGMDRTDYRSVAGAESMRENTTTGSTETCDTTSFMLEAHQQQRLNGSSSSSSSSSSDNQREGLELHYDKSFLRSSAFENQSPNLLMKSPK